MLGPYGAGKTHIVIAIGHATTQAGVRVSFIIDYDLLNLEQAAKLDKVKNAMRRVGHTQGC